MKNMVLLWLALIFLGHIAQAQSAAVRDSLLKKLKSLPNVRNDSTRVNTLNALAFEYYLNKPDSSYLLGQQAYELSRTFNYSLGETRALNVIALAFTQLGDYAKALKMLYQAKELSIKINNAERVTTTLNNIANLYMEQGEWQKGLLTMQECYAHYKTIAQPYPILKSVILSNIGECFYNLKQLDSAIVYFNEAIPLAEKYNRAALSNIQYLLGDVVFAKNNVAQAYSLYQQSIQVSIKEDNTIKLYEAYYRLAKLYQKTQQEDSTLYYAQLALTYSQKSTYLIGILRSSQLLTELYESKNDMQALQYFKIAVAAKDSMFSQDKVKQMLSLSFEEKQKAQEIEAANTEFKNKTSRSILIGILAVFGLIALLLFINNRQKQKTNVVLEKTLNTLKATQTQLIQSEKLASLGELTAGIAHEIQNPLNFVNNFSELSVDLANDLKDEIHKPDIDKEYVEELLTDLSQNQKKINHHGKRASSIVKGMLEHSRASTGVKELTDINKLADEYLRLSYHGLRAKDKDFNATMETHFQDPLSKIEIIPQDIGRVLLNLINNAFYAVNEKNRQNTEGVSYSSTVTVSTQHVDNQIVIKVEDNGIGMPESVRAKVFQPFFTTKPTGQGTGLGLSLAYDIVTKGHGGSLEVESTDGVGTEFVIKLPI